ncbi:hypothetical protein [Moraxella lacunata]
MCDNVIKNNKCFYKVSPFANEFNFVIITCYFLLNLLNNVRSVSWML